jgi:hypothetical protein
MTDSKSWGNISYPTRGDMLTDIVAVWFEPIDLGCLDTVTDQEMAEELLTHWPKINATAKDLAPYIATFRKSDTGPEWTHPSPPPGTYP